MGNNKLKFLNRHNNKNNQNQMIIMSLVRKSFQRYKKLKLSHRNCKSHCNENLGAGGGGVLYWWIISLS